MGNQADQLSFGEHLEALRKALLKIIAVCAVTSVVCFFFKEALFEWVLAPKNADFVTYKLLSRLSQTLSGGGIQGFTVCLINTNMTGQFIVHLQTALCAGIILASPYILYQLFVFVSPALYENERRYAVRIVGWGYTLFLVGVAVSYYLIFPLTFRFLATYQVSAEVGNLISLQSYISTLLTMSLSMGIVFEIPILCYLFGKLGFISASFMRRYRRHAIVLILIVAAVITPTSDAFTLMVVSLPMYVLYEASIWIVARTAKK